MITYVHTLVVVKWPVTSSNNALNNFCLLSTPFVHARDLNLIAETLDFERDFTEVKHEWALVFEALLLLAATCNKALYYY